MHIILPSETRCRDCNYDRSRNSRPNSNEPIQFKRHFRQLIGVNFALIAAIYYFLHNTMLPLKIIAFTLYSAGFGARLFLFTWENIHLDGLEFALNAIIEQGEASVVSETLHKNWGIGRTRIPDRIVAFVIAALWLAPAYLMFFYKFRKEE